MINAPMYRVFWEQFVPEGWELHGFTDNYSVTFRKRAEEGVPLVGQLAHFSGKELEIFIQLSLAAEQPNKKLLKKFFDAGYNKGWLNEADPYGESSLNSSTPSFTELYERLIHGEEL